MCGAAPLAKVLPPVPIHFKGSGFLLLDRLRPRVSQAPRRHTSEGDGTAKKDDTKTDKADTQRQTAEKKAAASES